MADWPTINAHKEGWALPLRRRKANRPSFDAKQLLTSLPHVRLSLPVTPADEKAALEELAFIFATPGIDEAGKPGTDGGDADQLEIGTYVDHEAGDDLEPDECLEGVRPTEGAYREEEEEDDDVPTSADGAIAAAMAATAAAEAVAAESFPNSIAAAESVDTISTAAAAAAMAAAEALEEEEAAEEMELHRSASPDSGCRGSTRRRPNAERAWAVLDESDVSDFGTRLPTPAVAYPFELDSFQKRVLIRLPLSIA